MTEAAPSASHPDPAASSTGALLPADRPLPPYTAIIDGHLLRDLRRQHGLSIDDLAHRAGVGITTLGRPERQARPRCRVTTLALLASQLGADPATIAVLVRLNKNEPPCLPPAA